STVWTEPQVITLGDHPLTRDTRVSARSMRTCHRLSPSQASLHDCGDRSRAVSTGHVDAPPSTASPASPAAVHSTVRPTSAPVRVFLPPCPASHCTAAGLLRQGQGLQASVLASLDRRDCACRLRHWRWQVDRVVATCPHAPRASLRSQGRSSSLLLPGCVLP